MAFTASQIWDVRTTGSDSNGGGFNPANANFATDGAATSATGNSPVFSSASYTFVASDVGAWLFIKSGTNWTPGWYQIASVAGGNATLSAAAGAGIRLTNSNPVGVTTAAGVATTASPTGATWGIDYSQQNSAQFAFTDMVIDGTTNTKFTSAAHPVGVNFVGNAINVTSGTGFTLQRVEVVSVSGTVATCDKSLGTLSSTGGNGNLGGALATPGQAGAVKIASNDVFIKSGTYTLANTTANTAGGPVSDTTGGSATAFSWWVGWSTNRHLYNTDSSPPTISAGAQTTLTIFNCATGSGTQVVNIGVDGNNGTGTRGFATSVTCTYFGCLAQNCKNSGFFANGGTVLEYLRCRATGCSTAGGGFLTQTFAFYFACESYGNTVTGFIVDTPTGAVFVNCIASGNTGATSDGFSPGSTSRWLSCFDCTSYGNGRHGFNPDASSTAQGFFANCIAEANVGAGWGTSAVCPGIRLTNCGGYNNSSNYSATQITAVFNFVANTTGSFFTNAAGGDFSLNNTANQGALARAAGYPGAFPRGTSTGYPDMGAVQHQDSGTGGSRATLLVG